MVGVEDEVESPPAPESVRPATVPDPDVVAPDPVVDPEAEALADAIPAVTPPRTSLWIIISCSGVIGVG